MVQGVGVDVIVNAAPLLDVAHKSIKLGNVELAPEHGKDHHQTTDATARQLQPHYGRD